MTGSPLDITSRTTAPLAIAFALAPFVFSAVEAVGSDALLLLVASRRSGDLAI